MSEEQEEKKPEAQPPAVLKRIPNSIALHEGGRALPVSVEELYRLATIYCKSGLVPKGFDTPEKIMVGWQLGAELGMGQSCLQVMYVVNGIPNLFGDGPLSVVLGRGIVKTWREEQFDASGKAICQANGNMDAECVAAVCRWERTNGIVTEKSFTLAEAKKAGLTGSGTYQKYLRRMLQMRARSWALKDGAPDVLRGVQIAEYDHNIVTDNTGRVVEDQQLKSPALPAPAEAGGADDINAIFGAQKEPALDDSNQS